MTMPRDRFTLRASEPITRTGPGRKQRMVSLESYEADQLPALLQRVEQLLAKGYLLSINPPAEAPPASPLPVIKPRRRLAAA